MNWQPTELEKTTEKGISIQNVQRFSKFQQQKSEKLKIGKGPKCFSKGDMQMDNKYMKK